MLDRARALTPVRHRQIGFETRGLAKRSPRFGMIECVGEVETLIDERLHLTIARRYRERVRTEILQPRRQRSARRRLCRLRLGGFPRNGRGHHGGRALPGHRARAREHCGQNKQRCKTSRMHDECAP
jgi:hypothetical protein